MAQPPASKTPANKTNDKAPTSKLARNKALARRGATGDVVAADERDPAAPVLLEYESPTAALIAAPVAARSRFMVWVLATFFFALLVLAGTVPIDRVVTTTGKVVSIASNVVVQPLETSIVRSIDVKEGQTVHAGDLLARLDPTFADSDAGSLEQQVASLQAEVNRLTAETQDRAYISDGTPPSQLQSSIFTQRHAERTFVREGFRQKIDSARAKVEQAQSDGNLYAQRLVAAKKVEDMRRELEHDQVGSKLNTLGALDTRLEVTRNFQAAEAMLEGAQRDLGGLTSERDSEEQKWRGDTSQQLSESGRKLDQAKQDLNKAKLRRNLVELRAEHDAIVLSVAPVSVGSVMQSGDQFITMVPVDAPLEVETVVEGRNAGFVRVGDPVTVKFDTFPYYTYGTAHGLVRMVSPDSFRNPNEDRQRVAKPHPGEEFGSLYYRTRLSLDEMKLHDLPPGFRLTPGMPVTGDIKIGKRTLLQYLMSRVVPATTEGMREP